MAETNNRKLERERRRALQDAVRRIDRSSPGRRNPADVANALNQQHPELAPVSPRQVVKARERIGTGRSRRLPWSRLLVSNPR